ncbi:adenylate kinase [Candidatus Woesearchaeota archaeon]|nr:adenylate kinase [Candidatus Woesearchaeota archaeon]
MKLIFLGAPGVGKGTIAKRVVKKYGLVQISTGDLLREAVKRGTELGHKAKKFMDAGDLVPDDLIIDMLKERLSHDDCSKGFILDGFPRTIPQAEALENSGVVIDKVLELAASHDVIIQRLSGRRTCTQCQAIFHITNMPSKQEGVCDKCNGELIQRDDDRPEAIQNRLQIYETQTKPLVEFYTAKDMLISIDAGKSVDKVFKDTIEALE